MGQKQTVHRLISAAQKDDAIQVSKLLEQISQGGADQQQFLNHQDELGNSFLHYSSFYGRFTWVLGFIERGADVNVRNRVGATALHCAAERGNIETLEALVKAGGDVNLRDNEGRTPLHTALQHEMVDVIPVLLAAGAQIEQTNKHGTTPLHHAAFKGLAPAVRLLLQNAAKNGLSIDLKDKNGSTPLHCAALNGHTGCLELLVEQTANIDSANCFGSTPLHCAAYNGHRSCAQLLVGKGASLTAKDYDGCTPLDAASDARHAECATYLLEVSDPQNTFSGNRDVSFLMETIGSQRSPRSNVAPLEARVPVPELPTHDVLQAATAAATTTSPRLGPLDPPKSSRKSSPRQKGSQHKSGSQQPLASARSHALPTDLPPTRGPLVNTAPSAANNSTAHAGLPPLGPQGSVPSLKAYNVLPPIS